MDFGMVLAHLKNGGRAARKNWNGKGMYIEIQWPDHESKMDHPFIFIKSVDGHKVPWVASQTDLLREDWFIVDYE